MGSFYSSNSAIDNIVLSADWLVAEGGMLEVALGHYLIWCGVNLEVTDQ